MTNFNKQEAITYYTKFMQAIGLDLNDPNAKDTPERVVKMYKNDIFKGLYESPPKVTTFPNQNGYTGIVFQGNITVHSVCSHHHCPIIGTAYIGYLPSKNGRVIGLSKLNRIVEYFARRPQIQENLTNQIHDYIDNIIKENLGVAIFIKAKHTCVSLRGIKHDSEMKTFKLSGKFETETQWQNKFFELITI